MSQDGSRKRSKRAKIAVTNDFENMRFDMFLIVRLEHQASQKSPKTAKKPPKTAPDSVQEPLKTKLDPFVKKNRPQNGPNS